MAGRALRILLVLLTFGAVAAGVAAVPDEPYDRVVGMLVRSLDGDIQDRPAPAFTASDLAGRPVSLEAFRGEVVLLNFWASWCPPCVEEFPSMLELADAMEGRSFRLVALTQDAEPEPMLEFLRALGLPDDRIVILQDPDGTIAKAYGTLLLPETYIIDPGGRIVARFQGERDWTQPEARQLSERLMRHSWRVGVPAPVEQER